MRALAPLAPRNPQLTRARRSRAAPPACRYKETSALLSWLPPVPGAESPPEARSGRRHLPVPGEIPGVLSSFLNHREYAPAKPRARGSLKPGGTGGRSRSRSRPAELSPSKLAAKLLPPIHGRTQPAEVEPPGWAVKSKRPPFKGR